jgi:hypothetical protein
MFFIQEIKGKTEIWIKRRPRQIIRRIKITKAVKSTWIKRIQIQSKGKKSRDVQNNLKNLDTQNQQSSSKFNLCKIIKNQKFCLDSLIIFKVQAGIIFYLMTTIIMTNFKVKAIKLLRTKIRISIFLKFWKRWSSRIGKIINKSSIKENLGLTAFWEMNFWKNILQT